MEETNTQYNSETPSTLIEEGKTMAIIAYITIFGLIIAFIMNNEKKNPFTAYHIRQSLGIGLTGLALSIASYVPFIGWLISLLGTILIIVLWVIALISAINAQEKPVPILGEKYQEWFKNI